MINHSFPIIDAHVHLDLKEQYPLRHLLDQMSAYNIEKVLLILNTDEERKAFDAEYALYFQNRHKVKIAAGLDVKNQLSFQFIEKMIANGENIVLKLHPRLFKIDKSLFPKIIASLAAFQGYTIMVDSLYYGEQIEYHVGIELAVVIAREYPHNKVVVAHSGSVDFLKCMMATRYLPNVYYDYSFIQSYFKNTSLKLDMVDFLSRTSNRICYGSDLPSFNIQDAIYDFEQLVHGANLSEDQIKMVFYENAENLYFNEIL